MKERRRRAHYLQHVPFEGLGSIEPWLVAAGYQVTGTLLFESTDLPALDELDLLVVMGGPMSVNDEEHLPWLAAEKAFVREAIAADKPVLGVCLGAQLIASVMGARVYLNGDKEIGWFPIRGEPSADDALFGFPSSVEVFHWHGETFDLPLGAVRLATSEASEIQAFQLGRSVLGLQFHLETTPETARRMVAGGASELRPSKYVQSEAEILAAPPERYRKANALMAEVLSFLSVSRG